MLPIMRIPRVYDSLSEESRGLAELESGAASWKARPLRHTLRERALPAAAGSRPARPDPKHETMPPSDQPPPSDVDAPYAQPEVEPEADHLGDGRVEADEQPPDASATDDKGADRATPRRRRKWLRRLGVFVAVTVFGVTGLSATFNLATDGRMSVPAGLTYVQTGDISTRYRQWGTTGTPIVLVHGFIESADTWQYLAPLLAAQGHRVYALDLDGWGYSQRVAPFDIGHQSTQLLDFIAALHLDHPILVGHSSGAAIAAAATLRSPSGVGGIMFLDGDGLATGAGQKTPFTKLLINPYRTTLLRLLVRSDAVVRAVYNNACGPTCPKLDAAGIDQWRRPLQVPGAETALWAMLNLGVAGLPPQQLTGLAGLHLPKSVVFGADDSAYTQDAPQQTANRIGAPAPTVIPGARHLTSVNSPAAVAAAIEALAARA